MNLAAFRSKVDRRTGHAFAEEALNDVINEALQAITADGDWPWLDRVFTFEHTAGVARNLPHDFSRLIRVSVDDATYSQVHGKELDVGHRYGPDSSFAIVDGNLVLSGAATGQTVTVRYYAEEPELENAADEPLLPHRWWPAVIAYASRLVFERTDDPRRVSAEADYDAWHKRMVKARRQAAGSSRIRVREDSPWS